MTEILSTVRVGRLVRQERLEDEGRIQSWVLAGERGVIEMRGTGQDCLYCLVHLPAAQGEFYGGHSLLMLVDAAVFPDHCCTVLDGPCRVVLLASPEHDTVCDPWTGLERLYRFHLGGDT